MKEINLDKSVYELTEAYPELTSILKDMGFLGLANPLVRNTLGRKTTLRQGIQKQGKDIAEVSRNLEEKGFKVNPS